MALIVSDDYQNKGVGTELLNYLTLIARREGLLGCVAEALSENKAVIHVLNKAGFCLKSEDEGMCILNTSFEESSKPGKAAPLSLHPNDTKGK